MQCVELFVLYSMDAGTKTVCIYESLDLPVPDWKTQRNFASHLESKSRTGVFLKRNIKSLKRAGKFKQRKMVYASDLGRFSKVRRIL